MEELLEKYNLHVDKIHGGNEYEMYSNYINEVDGNEIRRCLDDLLFQPEKKDNAKAEMYLKQGDLIFPDLPNNFFKCYFLYTTSLRYAEYNSENYARALLKRAVTNTTIEEYQHALVDIDLCLKANCSKECRLKALELKADCFKILENDEEMKKALKEHSDTLNDVIESKEKCNQKALDLMIEENYNVCNPDNTQTADLKLPAIEDSQSFTNASRTISFKHDQDKTYHVIANADIKAGDVLFVEKAFAFAPCYNLEGRSPEKERKSSLPPYCFHCMKTLQNSVPCKTCILNMYCNEDCRDKAWNEYHRWECQAINTNLFVINNHGYLAFRIILKAVSSGFCINNLVFKENNYHFVYNLPTNLDRIDTEWLTTHCATAALYVLYLKENTDFLSYVKKLQGTSKKSRVRLWNRIGGLFIRHCAQLHCYVTPLKMVTNPITDEGEEVVPEIFMTAMTMCPSVALMNHSCVPNTAHFFLGDSAVIKAITDIPAGKKLSRSYTSVFLPRTHLIFDLTNVEEKNRALEKFCFIKCTCEACSDSKKKNEMMLAYLCSKCKGPAGRIEHTEQVQCVNCNYKSILSKKALRKEKMAIDYLEDFQASDRKDVEKMYKALELCKAILHPYHTLHKKIYGEISLYHRMKNNAKDYITNANAKLQLIKEKGNMNTIQYGILSYRASWITVSIMKNKRVQDDIEFKHIVDEVNQILKEAERIFDLYYPPYQRYIDYLKEDIEEMRTARRISSSA